jgi:hypothetical protein
LPRLAAGVDNLSLSQVLAPFPSQEDETRFRQEARDGIMDLLKLLFEVRRRTTGKRAEGKVLSFFAYQPSHPRETFVSAFFPFPLPTPRPASPRITAPAPPLSMPWTRCWKQGHHVH